MGARFWCLQDEYISYKKNFKNRTAAQAQAEWEADFQNPDVAKRPGPRIAVGGIPKTQGWIERSVRRTLTANVYIGNEGSFAQAVSRLNVHALPGLAAGFSDVGGDVFRAGAASGLERELNPLANLSSGSATQMSYQDIQCLSLAAAQSTGGLHTPRALVARKSHTEDPARAGAGEGNEDPRPACLVRTQSAAC